MRLLEETPDLDDEHDQEAEIVCAYQFVENRDKHDGC